MNFIRKTALLCILLMILLGIQIKASNKVISYQSRMTDESGAVIPDDTYQFGFVLLTDSVAGLIVWAETAEISTSGGLLTHLIGSVNPLASEIFANYKDLYLDIQINGESISPRTQITSAAYAFSTVNVSSFDSLGIPSVATDENAHSLTIFDSLGDPYISLKNKLSDSAVMLPDSSINAEEILNEPGLTLSTQINLITLSTGEMVDLTDLTITIPDDGYIVLYGKCYLLLSGTTGANSAIIQIDEDEGGGTQFPYYSIAGLSGYVNSGTNYFPIMVTRVYYKNQGTYTFRLEGKANNALPAVAQSWDHILSAFYYPTSYYGVEEIVTDPTGFINAIPLEVHSDKTGRKSGQYFKVDLRELEIRDKEDK